MPPLGTPRRQAVGSVELGERPPLGVISVAGDVGVHLLPQPSPRVDGTVQPVRLDGVNGPAMRRRAPRRLPPREKPEPRGACSTLPRDSWPRTRRCAPSGAHPYSPETISLSVPQTPRARPRTSSSPSPGVGPGHSLNSIESARPGTTVTARIRHTPSPGRRTGPRQSGPAAMPRLCGRAQRSITCY